MRQLFSIVCFLIIYCFLSGIFLKKGCQLYAAVNPYTIVSSGVWDASLFKNGKLPSAKDYILIPAGKSVIIPSNDTIAVAGLKMGVTDRAHSSLTVEGVLSISDYMEIIVHFPDKQPQFLSLPFDVRISDGIIDSISGNSLYPGKELRIFEYDGAKRVVNGESVDVSDNFTEIEATSDSLSFLQANKGYVFISDTVRTICFRTFSDSTVSDLFSKISKIIPTELNVSATGSEFNDSWNLIGIPFLKDYEFSYSGEKGSALPRYFYHYNILKNRFDLLDSHSTLKDTIRPFTSYFVQTKGDTEIGFPTLSGSDDFFSNPVSEERATFLLSGSDGAKDRSDLIFNNEASKNYTIDEDAAKILQKGKPIVYTQNGSEHYAVNRRPLPDGEESLGLNIYIPDETSYRLDLAGVNLPNLFQHILINRIGSFSEGIDLLSAPLIIQGETGWLRYTIKMVPKITPINGAYNNAPYGVVNAGTLYLHHLPAVCRIDIYEMSGIVIYSLEVLNTEAEFVLPNPGIYIVRVKRDNNVDTFRVIY